MKNNKIPRDDIFNPVSYPSGTNSKSILILPVLFSGIKIPKNLILHGVPGVGKTLFATNFINALNRKKYIIRKNMPDGKFVDYLKNQVNDAMNNEQ